MYFDIITFGCKVNQYESGILKEALLKKGRVSKDPEYVIINSCCVTENAAVKTRTEIKRQRNLHPEVKIILTGCMAAVYKSAAEADYVVPIKKIPQFFSFLAEREHAEEYSPARTRGFLQIENGCNRQCAYCIIPKARGAVWSKPLDEVRKEAVKLSARHKEIVLLGINLLACEDFFGALRQTAEVAKRVRLSSMEPDLLTDSLIENLGDIPNLCDGFHISLQSGCDKTLKNMNRLYNTSQFRHTVDKLREVFPNCAVSTDIIAGFPGESESDFAESAAFAEEMSFSKIHAFVFSPREGTPAAGFGGQIYAEEKARRARELRVLSDKLRDKFAQSQVGCTAEVLFERTPPRVAEKYGGSVRIGHTRNFTKAAVFDESIKQHDMRKVKITSAEKGLCVGKLTERD